MMETITPTKPSRLAGLFKRTPKEAKPLSKEQKAKEKERRRKERADAHARFMKKIGYGSRATRRQFKSKVRHASHVSNKKCETKDCRNTIGIVTEGQLKRFCQDHNRKGRLERRRAQIARFARA